MIITKRGVKKSIRILKRHRRYEVFKGLDTTATDNLIKDFENLIEEINNGKVFEVDEEKAKLVLQKRNSV